MPLQQTITLLETYAAGLQIGSIKDDDLKTLLAVKFTRSPSFISDAPVSESNHSPTLGMVDFVQNIAPTIPPKILDTLITRMINLEDGDANSFFRASTLTKYFLTYQTITTPDMAQHHYTTGKIAELFPNPSNLEKFTSVLIKGAALNFDTNSTTFQENLIYTGILVQMLEHITAAILPAPELVSAPELMPAPELLPECDTYLPQLMQLVAFIQKAKAFGDIETSVLIAALTELDGMIQDPTLAVGCQALALQQADERHRTIGQQTGQRLALSSLMLAGMTILLPVTATAAVPMMVLGLASTVAARTAIPLRRNLNIEDLADLMSQLIERIIVVHQLQSAEQAAAATQSIPYHFGDATKSLLSQSFRTSADHAAVENASATACSSPSPESSSAPGTRPYQFGDKSRAAAGYMLSFWNASKSPDAAPAPADQHNAQP